MKCLLLVCPLVLVLAMPVQADWREVQIERTVNNIKALQSYQGTLEQTGLYGQHTVVAEVRFRRPHDFHAEVSEPAALSGAVNRYTDNKLLNWLPTEEIAVRVVNLPPAPAEKEAERIADAWRENNRRNFYALGSVKEVAGHSTIKLEQKARQDDALIRSGKSYIYDNFSFPLAGTLELAGGNELDYRYRDIRFNQSVNIPESPQMPPSTMVLEWDLQWTNHKCKALQARVPDANLPDTALDLPAKRRLIHPGALPSVALYYTNDNYFVLLTATRDFGVTLPGSDYGIPVPLNANTDARVVLSPIINTWTFAADGVAYTLMSNEHPEKVFDWLRKNNW